MTFTTLAAAASEQLVGIAGMLSADSAEAQAVRGRLPRFLGVDYQIVGVVRPSTAEELAATVGAANRRKLAILRVYSSSNVGASAAAGMSSQWPLQTAASSSQMAEIVKIVGLLISDPALQLLQNADCCQSEIVANVAIHRPARKAIDVCAGEPEIDFIP